MKAQPSKKVIATRKACKAQGTGLSHFILMDKEIKKAKGPQK
jgi:modified peptide precursor CbpA